MAQQNITTTCSPQICQLILVVHSDIASIAIMIMTSVWQVLIVRIPHHHHHHHHQCHHHHHANVQAPSLAVWQVMRRQREVGLASVSLVIVLGKPPLLPYFIWVHHWSSTVHFVNADN